MLGLFKKAATKKQAWPYSHEIQAVIILVATFFLTVILISHNPHDQSWFYYDTMAAPIANWCGYIGACVAATSFYLLGSAACMLLFLLLFLFQCRIARKKVASERARVIALSIMPIVVASLLALYEVDFLGSMVAGGYCGRLCVALLHAWLNDIGTYLFLYIAVIMLLIVIMPDICLSAVRFIVSPAMVQRIKKIIMMPVCIIGWMMSTAMKRVKIIGSRLFGYRMRDAVTVFESWQSVVDSTSSPTADTHKTSQKKYPDKNAVSVENLAIHQIAENACQMDGYQFPECHLFEAHEQEQVESGSMQELEKSARTLEQKLERFDVYGTVVAIKRGPVITLFEYQPHIDTKISKIIALEDDLALALQAVSIRIIAPIPGRSVVGFEVANKQRTNVLLSQLIKSDAYANTAAVLPMILGMDTIGNAVVIDLAKMPHLLMAGSTGSGKSVALNAMVISLLCKVSPDDLRLIIIDPKRLEFVPYADIAHLLFPLVNDPKKAPAVLRWLVKHMEERYQIMAQAGARNIHDYRQQMAQKNEPTMPFIVVIIDELADLMMCAGKEIEDAIIRISQMARAAGIHLIAATQRPSVDVITGLIKVNFPSRISFRVTSKVDSRTILDCAGADKLLGRGDLLFLDAHESSLKRVHGAYVLDKEIQRITAHIRAQRALDYLDLNQICTQEQAQSHEQDPLYDQICHFLQEVDEVSISLLQRRFRIGYNRSARIIDMLAIQRLIEPSYGGKTRKVVRQ